MGRSGYGEDWLCPGVHPGPEPQAQHAALRAAGSERIFTDSASGKLAERPRLATCLDYLRPGDTLVCTMLDRLGRPVDGCGIAAWPGAGWLLFSSSRTACRNLHSQPATVWTSTTAESSPTTVTQSVATARNIGPLAASPRTDRRLARIRM